MIGLEALELRRSSEPRQMVWRHDADLCSVSVRPTHRATSLDTYSAFFAADLTACEF